MAAETDVDGIGLRQPRIGASVRIVAVGAIAGSAGVLHFCGVDQLGLVVVACDANFFCGGLSEDDLPIFGSGMAHVAALVGEGRMHELCHQLGRRGLVRIMAAQAVGGGERLTLMRLLKAGGLGIVTVQAKGGCGFREMELVLGREIGAGFVGGVAGIAAHIERGVAAAFCRNIQALRVAVETEVLALFAASGLKQLIFVIGFVRVVALGAIADGRWMHMALDLGGILIGVAAETKFVRSGRNELDVRDVFVYPDFVTAETTHGDG